MDIANVTFDSLRLKYRTGRSFVVSGTGRDRVYGYRHGVATELGDIEESEWIDLAMDLIRRSGELDLLDALKKWCKEYALTSLSRKEVEFDALQLHVSRTFDNPLWVSYIPFNRKYRPDVLSRAELVQIIPACCNTPGLVTKQRIDHPLFSFDGPQVYCPHCGRATTYTYLS